MGEGFVPPIEFRTTRPRHPIAINTNIAMETATSVTTLSIIFVKNRIACRSIYYLFLLFESLLQVDINLIKIRANLGLKFILLILFHFFNLKSRFLWNY
jgi:hypothetical protein